MRLTRTSHEARRSALGRTAIRAAALLAYAILLATSLAAAAPVRPAALDSGAVTPVIATLIPQDVIAPVRTTDGRLHVMYEFMVTNTVTQSAVLHSVAAIDAGNGAVLRTLEPADLIAGEALKKLDRTPVLTTVIPAGQSRVLFLDVGFASWADVPREIEHRFELRALNPFVNRTERFAYTIAPVEIARRRPPVLGPPLDGEGWLASDGCCSPASHVAATYGLGGKLQAAERYAVDWIQVAADGRIFHGDPARLDSWVGYGARVKAAADGVVTAVLDGLPDQVPLEKPPALPFHQLPGNHVVVRMARGLHAVYAHLQPGSVAVRVGDRVASGDPIGLLGNSGASLAPHLHFHVVDGPSVFTSDGYPYEIAGFDLAASSDIGALAVALQGKPGFPTRDRMHPVARSREQPLAFSIVDFPSAR